MLSITANAQQTVNNVHSFRKKLSRDSNQLHVFKSQEFVNLLAQNPDLN